MLKVVLCEPDSDHSQRLMRGLILAGIQCLPTATATAAQRLLRYVEVDALVARHGTGNPSLESLLLSAAARSFAPALALVTETDPVLEGEPPYRRLEAGLLTTERGRETFAEELARLAADDRQMRHRLTIQPTCIFALAG